MICGKIGDIKSNMKRVIGGTFGATRELCKFKYSMLIKKQIMLITILKNSMYMLILYAKYIKRKDSFDNVGLV